MTECKVTLNEKECEFLRGTLNAVLKEAQVEEHRTRAPAYREHILEREEMINGLLSKLNGSAK